MQRTCRIARTSRSFGTSETVDRGGDAVIDPLPDGVDFGIGELVLAGRHLPCDQLVDQQALGGIARNHHGSGGAALEDGVGSAEVELPLRNRAVAHHALAQQDGLDVFLKGRIGGARKGSQDEYGKQCPHECFADCTVNGLPEARRLLCW